MRKLITGLLATLTIVFAMSPSASAQEAPAEDTTEQEQPTNTVDCDMLNFTLPELRNEDGNYVVGNPITLELSVLKGGAMYYYFMALPLDAMEPYPLNDGMDNHLVWTPTEPGTYTVFGEFEDTKTGQPVLVENPDDCDVVLTVAAAAPAEPEPVEPTPPPTTEPSDDDAPLCGPPETLTLVDVGNGFYDVYNADGELCSQIGGEQTPASVTPVIARSAELPRTGSATTALAIAGVSLVFFGLVLKRFGRLRLDA